MATSRTARPEPPVRVKSALDLGVLIRAARETRGWTQAELADRANVGRQWLVTVEKGRHSRAEIGMLLRVIAAVGIELSAQSPGTRIPDRTRKPAIAALPASARVNLDDVLDRAQHG